MWGRCVYRWSDLDFEANAKEGFGVDWPLGLKDLGPGWGYGGRVVGIRGRGGECRERGGASADGKMPNSILRIPHTEVTIS